MQARIESDKTPGKQHQFHDVLLMLPLPKSLINLLTKDLTKPA